MSYLGTTKIGKIYLGSTALGKVYLGSDLVYQTGGGPTPPPVPAGYTALAYVESPTGNTAYVKTGIVANNTTGFNIDALPYDTTGPTNYGCLFGGRASSNNNDFQLSTFCSDANTQGTLRRGTSSQNYNAKIIPGTRLKASLVGNTFSRNGETVSTGASLASGKEIYLFALNNNGVAAQHGHLRVYSFSLTENGAAVLNYIPCKRDLDDVVGFWDTVAQEFVTPTSGTLYGPAVSAYDARVEYLESTGTQYIDTGIYGTQIVGFEAQYLFNSLTGSSFTVLGGRQAYNNNGLQLSSFNGGSSYGTVQVAGTLYSNLGTDATGTLYTVKLENNAVTVNGTQKATVTSSSFLSPRTAYLFALNNNGTLAEQMQGRIYGVRIFNRTTLTEVAHFVPVRVGQTGYMYETYGGTLYGNAGTGDFNIGNDI